MLDPVPHGRIGPPIDHEMFAPKAHNQTADLLEALRRRRGERDPMDPDPEEQPGHPATGQVRLIDIPIETLDDAPVGSAGTPSAGSTGTGPHGVRGSRKGRPSMPSWDEIVFGARTDDDV